VAYAGGPDARCEEVRRDAIQAGDSPANCVRRPDGDVLLLTTSRGAHQGGGRSDVNSAMLFTEDGYEIFAMSYNSADKEEPVLARNAPLSTAELAGAVTSDIWSH
jgi:hypothetical protein